jgi:ERCC4-type nuclease
MELVVDCREQAIISKLNDLAEDFSKSQLIIGDMIIKDQSGNINCIFERKTIQDLYSSIISRRFPEQRERLKSYRSDQNNIGNKIKIVYLIEGLGLETAKSFGGISINVVFGAIENLVMKHDIYVIQTINTEHTVKTLLNIRKKADNQSNNLVCNEIVPIQRKVKILDNIFYHQLTLIPGVSTLVASKIVELYPNFQVFAMEKETVKEKIQNLTVGKKKIGKVVAERIYNVYF